MQYWIQNLLVILAVAACLWVVIRQGARTFYGKRSRLGSCCSKGCGSEPAKKDSGQNVQFIPSELLVKRK